MLKSIRGLRITLKKLKKTRNNTCKHRLKIRNKSSQISLYLWDITLQNSSRYRMKIIILNHQLWTVSTILKAWMERYSIKTPFKINFNLKILRSSLGFSSLTLKPIHPRHLWNKIMHTWVFLIKTPITVMMIGWSRVGLQVWKAPPF